MSGPKGAAMLLGIPASTLASQLRRLGIYSVECYEKQFRSLDAAGALERSPDFPDDSAILADPDLYSRRTGLSMEIEEGRAIIL